MFPSKKAQSEAITLVLVAGIVIGLVGLAYSWGKPLIDKRSVLTDYTTAVQFMKELDKKIVEIAGSCSSAGSCEYSLNIPKGIISFDDTSNSIVYILTTNQPLVTKDTLLLNTADNNTVSKYGETPGVISFKGENIGSGNYRLIFYLKYRELDSNAPFKGYLIKLKGSEKKDGTSKIIISYAGSQVNTGEAHHGGDIVISNIKVQPV